MFFHDLLELISNKLIFNVFFFGIVFLDGLGAVYTEHLNRQVTIYIPIPLIFIIYIINIKKKEILFLTSLVFHFLGIYYFNAPYEKFSSLGILFHSIAFLMYFIILFKHYEIINIKKVLINSGIVMVLAFIPTIIYAKGMRERMMFNDLMLYITIVILFISSALLLYITHKTKANRYLLFSAICLLLSSYSQGYNLFMEKTNVLVAFAVIFFNLTHFSICWFLVEKQRQKLVID